MVRVRMMMRMVMMMMTMTRMNGDTMTQSCQSHPIKLIPGLKQLRPGLTVKALRDLDGGNQNIISLQNRVNATL